MNRTWLLVAIFSLAFPPGVRADVVVLSDGKIIEGKIAQETESAVVVEVGTVKMRLPREKVVLIEKGSTSVEVYQHRLSTLKPDDLTGHIELARFCEERRLNDEAIALYRNVLKLNPAQEGVREKLRQLSAGPAAAIWRKAEALFEAGQYVAASQECQNLIQFYPEADLVPKAYLELGLSLERLDRKAEAEAALKKAVDLDPKLLEGHKALVEHFIDSDQWGAIVAHCDAFAARKPPKPVADYLAGQLQTGRLGAEYRLKLERNPADSASAAGLAGLLERLGRCGKAIRVLRAAQEQGASDFALLMQLGNLQKERFALQAAQAAFSEALGKARTDEDRARVRAELDGIAALLSVPTYLHDPPKREQILEALLATKASWRDVMRAAAMPIPKPPQEKGLTEGSSFCPEGGRRVRYMLYIPPEYDGTERFPLLLSLHGAGTTGNTEIRGMLKSLSEPRYFVLCPTLDYDKGADVCESLALGALRDAYRKLNVDTDRVYISGLSAGGFIAWRLIVDYPQLFAGAFLRSTRAEDVTQLRLVNARTVPLYVSHGTADSQIPIAGVADLVGRLRDFGANVNFFEVKTAGHAAFFEYAPRALQWLLASRRSKAPKSIEMKNWNVDASGVYWVRVLSYTKDVLDPYRPIPVTLPAGYKLDPEATARIRLQKMAEKLGYVAAKINENRITIKTRLVAQLRVYLPDELINFARPVTIVVNGDEYAEKSFEPSVLEVLNSALANLDPGLSYPASIEIEVRPPAR